MELKDISPKQRKELLNINPLLCKYGFEECADMCSDRPDICLPSIHNRQVGIEVTEYTNPNDKRDISAFRSLIEQYLSELSKRDLNLNTHKYSEEKHYCLTVWLHGGSFPRIDNINRRKKQLFEELDRFAFPHCKHFTNEYIHSLRIEEITSPEISNSIVRISYVEAYSQIDEKALLKCISSKEGKLREYRDIKDNNNIREYWLAIIISDPIQVDIRGFQLNATISSDYNKIFLIKGIQCVQIK